jgi:hypothetical protein
MGAHKAGKQRLGGPHVKYNTVDMGFPFANVSTIVVRVEKGWSQERFDGGEFRR